jgi:hypothetical protein
MYNARESQMRRANDTEFEASLYKIGWIRLNMAAAYALGQEVVDDGYFGQPPTERNLLSIELISGAEGRIRSANEAL